jgi:hypothetical protein
LSYRLWKPGARFVRWPECINRNHHGSMAHHKPRVRYDARYANPHLNQYRYNYEISFQRQKPTYTMMPVLTSQSAPRRSLSRATAVSAAIVILLFFASCLHSAKRDSVSWDESQHLYSGWLSWERGDVGYNPEVPPLVKMWDAIPLLHRDIKQPAFTGDSFQERGFRSRPAFPGCQWHRSNVDTCTGHGFAASHTLLHVDRPALRKP